jgi:ornithine carbamoyltransferase
MVGTGLESRSFLKELDFTAAEWRSLLDLSAQLKSDKHNKTEVQRLVGSNIALIFEKASTQTRCAFEVAAHDQGAHVTYLDPADSHLGHKESAADMARVLGRMYDGIEYRGFSQYTIETLARFSGVPVWNRLTDVWHPTPSLCDMLTMREHAGRPDSDISFAYVGDARHNTGLQLVAAGLRHLAFAGMGAAILLRSRIGSS